CRQRAAPPFPPPQRFLSPQFTTAFPRRRHSRPTGVKPQKRLPQNDFSFWLKCNENYLPGLPSISLSSLSTGLRSENRSSSPSKYSTPSVRRFSSGTSFLGMSILSELEPVPGRSLRPF